jgi:hypothetical protein
MHRRSKTVSTLSIANWEPKTMNLYAYTISTAIGTYHECVCATDYNAALSSVLASLPAGAVLIELELV